MKKILLFLFAMPLLFSCTSDSLSDLVEVEEVEILSYTSEIKPIIDENCTSCHGVTPTNGAPMSLTTYEEVVEAMQNRSLLDRISQPESTSGAMPLGGPRLPQSEINLIAQWEVTGLQR